MKIETQTLEDCAVLRLSGDFETYAIAGFLEAVEEARRAGHDLLVLNLRRVDFLNSTAIGSMLRVRKELRAAGGGLALARPSAFVRGVLEKLGLGEVLAVYESEEEAAGALRREQASRQVEAAPGEEDAALFFRFYDQERADLLGRRGVAAGEIALLDLDGLTFTWNGGRHGFDEEAMRRLLAPGTALALKFRLPLYSKRTYYVADAEVSDLKVEDGRARVQATFTSLDSDATAAVRQYVADMELVRQELDAARRAE